jgi:hypothetical protein
MALPSGLLFLELLEAVYKYLLPNTDLDHILGKQYASLIWKEDVYTIPPERIRLLVKRYFEFPEFYSKFAERQFAKLDPSAELAFDLMQENEALFGKLSVDPVQVARITRFPLPEWTFLDQQTMDGVLYDFNLQLDHEVSLWPVNPSLDYRYYYLIVGSVVPRMLGAYYIDQVSRVRL